MNRLLLSLAAVIGAALIGDGIRAAGRALLLRAETDDMALWAELGFVDDDDNDNETRH